MTEIKFRSGFGFFSPFLLSQKSFCHVFFTGLQTYYRHSNGFWYSEGNSGGWQLRHSNGTVQRHQADIQQCKILHSKQKVKGSCQYLRVYECLNEIKLQNNICLSVLLIKLLLEWIVGRNRTKPFKMFICCLVGAFPIVVLCSF